MTDGNTIHLSIKDTSSRVIFSDETCVLLESNYEPAQFMAADNFSMERIPGQLQELLTKVPSVSIVPIFGIQGSFYSAMPAWLSVLKKVRILDLKHIEIKDFDIEQLIL